MFSQGKRMRVTATLFITIAFLSTISCARDASTSKQTEAILLEDPFYVVLKQFDPVTFKAVAERITEDLEKGTSQAKAIDNAFDQVFPVLTKRLQYASTPELIAFERVVVKELVALQKQDPAICFKWMFPKKGESVLLENYLSPELIEDSHRSVSRAIASSYEHPQNLPELAAYSGDRQIVAGRLQSKYGEKLSWLQEPSDPNVDKLTVCEMRTDIIRFALELPDERAATLFRFMYSSM